ncbi:MAG: glycosyltransferase family 1 protein [Candidatus Moranbacteria bacterium]|nr:glycosyltransferase family 1 protein [Candidatus Moranbacteria bacterium]
MRIGIDIRCLVEGRHTGVEEYTINLLHHLFAIDKKNRYVLFLNSFRKPNFDFSEFAEYKNVSVKKFNYPNKLLNFLFWYFDWPKIDRLIGGTDVMFFPNIIFSAWSKKSKAVFTIHDLSFERYPETFSAKRRLWHVFINPKKICGKADRIISVSDSTKNDLQEIYEIPEGKIKTIYNGVSGKFSPIDRNNSKLVIVKEKYKLPYKFVLYLGTIEPRKNIIGVIRAYNQLRKLNHPELERHKLVIAGASGWKQKQIFEEIGKSPFQSDIIFAGFIDDKDKPAVYNLASLFVYPSFFEGFGFPPLEAMSCGIPVIASNNSSFPETVGSAGVMTDPDKPDEIYRAMKEILLDKKLQEQFREKGIAQVRKFDWRKTAQEFLKIIQSLNK